MGRIVVVTGGSAGVGRATVEAFARDGCDVGILARGPERLEQAAAEARRHGVRAVAVPTDVSDADAVEAAAERIERELGPIDVWVNNAMATVFAPVSKLTPAEIRRGTEVTYLGTTHGTMTALRRMRTRGGRIINVGSALAYRAIPLQSVYCASKFAIRGFTDALRAEILHDKLPVRLSMVHLAAMNTPQFNWALNKMDRRPQPVPPIYQPEVAARAVVFASHHYRREIWVGYPTVMTILANRVAPGLLDHYLARTGYSGQLTDEPKQPDAPANLFEPVRNDPEGAHGRFDSRARDTSWEMFTSRHKAALVAGSVLAGGLGLRSWLRSREKASRHVARR